MKLSAFVLFGTGLASDWTMIQEEDECDGISNADLRMTFPIELPLTWSIRGRGARL